MTPPASPSLRPAIVWGLESQIGLWILRELGRHGIPVIGLAGDAHGVGRSSRYVVHSEVALARGPELLAQIRALGERWGPCLMITVSEGNALWLARHRNELGQVRALLPDSDVLMHAFDKSETLALAEEIGIRVPRTELPTSPADVDRIAPEFPYPAILKWADSNAVYPRLSAAGIEMRKAEYVYEAAEFRECMHRYDGIGTWPLVQQYCPGRGLGQFFFMHDGQPLRRFQHVRIAEWPPEGGFSSVCDAVPLDRHRELQEKSVELLRRMGWEGVAMVEYRFDEATNQAALMEVNGRYWGSFPLAAHCRAGFALYHYFVQGLGQDFALPPPRTDLRGRMVVTELKRLMRIVLQPGKIRDRTFVRRPMWEIIRFCADFLRPGVRYYLWTPDDPRPFFADVANYLLRRG